MRSIIIISVLLFISFGSFSQEPGRKEMRQLQKQMKKEQKADETAQKAAVVKWMVENKLFVLEADRLRDKRGNIRNVSPMINFLASDSITGVIQIGSNGYVGLNGVGGITVEGRISDYTYKHNPKNGTYNAYYTVQSSLGTYDVRLIVFQEGRAEATISSNWPGQLTYVGYLVPPSLSKVYKGTSYF